jgi:hypothetical protein
MRLSLVSVLLASVGCSTPAAPPVAMKQITLLASHGLWGGTNVYLQADGTLWVQDHPRGQGQIERRYESSLPASEMKELGDLIQQADLPSLKIPERIGVPDETSVTLLLVLEDGRRVQRSAFVNDVHAGFTPVYHWLRVRGERLDRNKPVYDGKPDPEWKPPNF